MLRDRDKSEWTGLIEYLLLYSHEIVPFLD